MSRVGLVTWIVFSGLLLIFSLIALAAGNEPHIRVHVTDAYGNTVLAQRITMTADGVTTTIPQDVAIDCKYGRYAFAVSVPGFSDLNELVLVDQPDQIISLMMRLGAMETPSPRCSVRGMLVPEASVARIRLMELFGSYIADVPVRPGGAFEFRNLECGDYMLVVMGPKGCLGTKLTRAGVTPERLDISLGRNSDGCASIK